MGMRNAVRQTGVMPFVVLLVLLWTVVTALDVVNTMSAYDGLGTQYVGQTFVGGAVGLLVLLGFGAAAAYLYAELGEASPGPQEFPPR